MASFLYPWDEPEEKEKPQPITTEPTTLEEQQQAFEELHREEQARKSSEQAKAAFDDMFSESMTSLDTMMKGVFKT